MARLIKMIRTRRSMNDPDPTIKVFEQGKVYRVPRDVTEADADAFLRHKWAIEQKLLKDLDDAPENKALKGPAHNKTRKKR